MIQLTGWNNREATVCAPEQHKESALKLFENAGGRVAGCYFSRIWTQTTGFHERGKRNLEYRDTCRVHVLQENIAVRNRSPIYKG